MLLFKRRKKNIYSELCVCVSDGFSRLTLPFKLLRLNAPQRRRRRHAYQQHYIERASVHEHGARFRIDSNGRRGVGDGGVFFVASVERIACVCMYYVYFYIARNVQSENAIKIANTLDFDNLAAVILLVFNIV